MRASGDEQCPDEAACAESRVDEGVCAIAAVESLLDEEGEYDREVVAPEFR